MSAAGLISWKMGGFLRGKLGNTLVYCVFVEDLMRMRMVVDI